MYFPLYYSYIYKDVLELLMREALKNRPPIFPSLNINRDVLELLVKGASEKYIQFLGLKNVQYK